MHRSPLRRRPLSAIATVLAIALGPVVATAADYEPAAPLSAAKLLPPDLLAGPNHSVADRVDNDGLVNTFTIDTKYGQVRATTIAQLRKGIAETDAMIRMDGVKGTDEFAKGMSEKAGDVVEGAKGLVTDPLGTASGAVSGVKSLFGRASERLSSGPGAEESGTIDTLTGFAKVKREYAAEFGVDVYSRNPLLQARLDEIARAGFRGTFSLTVALMAVPGGAGVAVSAAGNTSTLNEVFRDLPPTELRKRNRGKLQTFGTSADITDLFVGNAVFTPREQTLLVEALGSMNGTAGRDSFVKFAVLTNDAEVAYYRQRQAQMYAGYNSRVAPLASFVTLGQASAAQRADGVVVFCAPLDYLYWTADVAAGVKAIDAAVTALPGVKGRELWVSGTLSPLARQQVEALGWKVNAGSEGKLLPSW